MTARGIEILFEDNHLLAVNKPAGLATQGATPGEPSLITVAKQYIKARYEKPGNVYLGVVSRLDSLVSGVVVLARTSKAAARLSDQFANGAAHKTYWAIVEAEPQPPAGSCVDWLWHDDAHHRVVVARSHQADAKEARLTYRLLRRVERGWLLEVCPETGRKHQIRVQLSARDWPIVGDTKYGATARWPKGIALHSRRLEVMHPVKGTPVILEAPLPAGWPKLLGNGT